MALSGAATVPEAQPLSPTIGPVTDRADTVAQYRLHWSDGTLDRNADREQRWLRREATSAHTIRTAPRRAASPSTWSTRTVRTPVPAVSIVAVQNVAPVITALSYQRSHARRRRHPHTRRQFRGCAGLLDAHTVRIDWGDGAPPSNQCLSRRARQFDATHQYRDDSPSGARITVQVNDGVAQTPPR